MTDKLPLRAEVAAEHTWDAASVFPSHEAWEQEFRAVLEAISRLEAFRGRLGSDPVTLRQWLDTTHALFNRVGRLYVYASMFHEVDATDQAAKARASRATGLYARASAAAAFGEPEIVAIGFDALKRWMAADPALALYAHYFDQIRRRQSHIRSPEIEELLGQIEEPFERARGIHSILSDADLAFRPALDSEGREHQVAHGSIGRLLTSSDRSLRRSAWESYADAFLSCRNTVAECLATGVTQNVVLARARRYSSALEAALTPAGIPVEVFHNLIATFQSHIPIWHRYWRIRKRALGYEELHPADVKAPLSRSEPVVPFEQAMDWIEAGMAPLGAEYVEAMRKGVREQRWVDRYPNEGKRMGAFSSGVRGTHPFILMSYTDDLFSLSTLAHELGHSMHSYLTWRTQPEVYADYSLFVAEVASNFNQALVRAHLLRRNPDPDFQIAVIEEAMANFHRYFLIMPTLARFELDIHEQVERGEALTADGLMGLMNSLFRDVYGDEVTADEERVGITWAQFPTHMYSNFYVYQYATGIAGAHALAEQVLEEGEPAAERYLEFLRSGGSLYPLEALQRAGVDLASPEPVQRAFAAMDRMIDRLESLTSRS